MHTLCADELKRLATDIGFFTKIETPKENDKFGTSNVTWQTAAMKLSDDSS